MARRLTIATQEMGLSGSEAIVLAYLLRDSGCAPANIRHAVGLHRSTLSSMLDRLEQKDLIRRERCAFDRRRLEIDLTRIGRATAEIADAVIRDIEDDLAVFTSAADRRGADQVFAACVAVLWPGEHIDV
jgi:DNA-binding MarR family transcriptional regulator